jgi:hypothetical protein
VVFHVTPHAGGWAINRVGAELPEAVVNLKKEALVVARGLAKTLPSSQVVIHGKDGRIQDEWTYGDDRGGSPG